MKLTDRVVLSTFLGTKASNEPFNSTENYWKLIGEKGEIIRIKNQKVLVLFDKEIDSFQLENHNEIKNSLWILETDLKRIGN